MLAREPKDWVVDDLKIQGTQYRFSRPGNTPGPETVIDNFMVLPGGRTARDMDDVDRSARHSILKHFGAGQVQLVYDSNLSDKQRRELFELFMSEAMPLLRSMMRHTEEGKW
jgi:hypothetical protein